MTPPGSLELWPDSEPAWWVAERLPSIALDVRAVVPEGFDAYARIFHPAGRIEEDAERPVRWEEVAAANGRVVHPEMQWPHISGAWEESGLSVPGLWDAEPLIGSMPEAVAVSLGELLAAHTGTPERCWFAVWDGWGGLWPSPDDGSVATLTMRRALPVRIVQGIGRRAAEAWRMVRRPAPSGPEPTLRLPNREYHLLSGPISAVTESMVAFSGWQSANLWWPDDRSWFVATEIDLSSTYIGGDRATIAAVLASPDLEAIAVELDHGITDDSDRVNPPPALPFT